MIYNNENGNITAGGYSVNSILLNEQEPVMYNGKSLQGGKGKHTKVSERFKHLAVPAGLLYINDSNCMNDTNHIEDLERNDDISIINDELYERILLLAQPISINTTKKHTRSKKGKTKTKIGSKKKTKRVYANK